MTVPPTEKVLGAQERKEKVDDAKFVRRALFTLFLEDLIVRGIQIELWTDMLGKRDDLYPPMLTVLKKDLPRYFEEKQETFPLRRKILSGFITPYNDAW